MNTLVHEDQSSDLDRPFVSDEDCSGISTVDDPDDCVMTALNNSLTSLNWLQNLNSASCADDAHDVIANVTSPTIEGKSQGAEGEGQSTIEASVTRCNSLQNNGATTPTAFRDSISSASNYSADSRSVTAGFQKLPSSAAPQPPSLNTTEDFRNRCSVKRHATTHLSHQPDNRFSTSFPLEQPQHPGIHQLCPDSVHGPIAMYYAQRTVTADTDPPGLMSSTPNPAHLLTRVHSMPVAAVQPYRPVIDYKTNSQAKPPHSYATLICMAMRATPGGKVSLSAIYDWIQTNFLYFKFADCSWQNSIRHNLSMNKCFEKVPRSKTDEPGKGGFWRLNPNYNNSSDSASNNNNNNSYLPNGYLNKKRRSLTYLSSSRANFISPYGSRMTSSFCRPVFDYASLNPATMSHQQYGYLGFVRPNAFYDNRLLPGGIMPGGVMPGGAMLGGALPGGVLSGGIIPGGNVAQQTTTVDDGSALTLASGFLNPSIVLKPDPISDDRFKEDVRSSIVSSAPPTQLNSTLGDGLVELLDLSWSSMVAEDMLSESGMRRLTEDLNASMSESVLGNSKDRNADQMRTSASEDTTHRVGMNTCVKQYEERPNGADHSSDFPKSFCLRDPLLVKEEPRYSDVYLGNPRVSLPQAHQVTSNGKFHQPLITITDQVTSYCTKHDSDPLLANMRTPRRVTSPGDVQGDDDNFDNMYPGWNETVDDELNFDATGLPPILSPQTTVDPSDEFCVRGVALRPIIGSPPPENSMLSFDELSLNVSTADNDDDDGDDNIDMFHNDLNRQDDWISDYSNYPTSFDEFESWCSGANASGQSDVDKLF